MPQHLKHPLEAQRIPIAHYSDLDFFVIVKPGSKSAYLENLSWLTEVAPVAYSFRNTAAGYKFLYHDGVFCEFAVFEADELQEAVFSPGRIVWRATGVADDIRVPRKSIQQDASPSIEWLVGEALTNLYVGLSRDWRGEQLSAARFIQGYAVDRILQLTNEIMDPATDDKDQFDAERRFELRFPKMKHILPDLIQGYSKNRESAFAILKFLDDHFDINPSMKQEILMLSKNES